MAELLATLQGLFTFAFVVSSMLAMGLALTVRQVIEPLSNLRLVPLALAAEFGRRAATGEEAPNGEPAVSVERAVEP